MFVFMLLWLHRLQSLHQIREAYQENIFLSSIRKSLLWVFIKRLWQGKAFLMCTNNILYFWGGGGGGGLWKKKKE